MKISLLNLIRYLNRRKPKSGFYNPPPMLMRYARQRAYNSDVYSTLDRPTTGGTYPTLSSQTQPVSLAMSQQSTPHSSTNVIHVIMNQATKVVLQTI